MFVHGLLTMSTLMMITMCKGLPQYDQNNYYTTTIVKGHELVQQLLHMHAVSDNVL